MAVALNRLASAELSLVAAVTEPHGCWAEVVRLPEQAGEVRQSADGESCLVGVCQDGSGAVSRIVWVCAPRVPAYELDPESPAPDARPIFTRYFTDLMEARFTEAAGHFTSDTIYSHPPYASGGHWVLFRSRDALEHGWVTQRGATRARQIITRFAQRRGRVFLEGIVDNIPDGGTFFSTAQVTPAGKIARYLAFYSSTRIA